MRRSASLRWAFCLPWWTLPALGQAATAEPLELSLEDAEARAAEFAPSVAIAKDEIRVAAASRVGAGVLLPVNPRLAFDARPGLDCETRGAVGFGSTLDVLFELGGGPSARMQEAAARVRFASAEGERVKVEARLLVLAAYAAERIAALRAEQGREAIALAERVLQAAIERSAAGAGSEIEVSSARAELAEFRAALSAAEADRSQSEMELRYLLAIPARQPLTLTSPIDKPVIPAAMPELLRRAQAHMPGLASIKTRLALLAASDKRLRAEATPKLGAYVGLDSAPRSPLFGVAGLSIELPVAQRNQGPRAVVAAERERERDRYQLTTSRLDLALRAVRAAYEARRAELAVLTDDGLPAAQAHYQLVEIGWRAGRLDIFRLTTAAQSLVRLKAARVEVLTHIWRQRAMLERLTGGTIDEHS